MIYLRYSGVGQIFANMTVNGITANGGASMAPSMNIQVKSNEGIIYLFIFILVYFNIWKAYVGFTASSRNGYKPINITFFKFVNGGILFLTFVL